MSMKCNYCGEPIDDKSIYWEDDDGNLFCRERHLDAFELAQEKSTSVPSGSTTLQIRYERLNRAFIELNSAFYEAAGYPRDEIETALVAIRKALEKCDNDLRQEGN